MPVAIVVTVAAVVSLVVGVAATAVNRGVVVTLIVVVVRWSSWILLHHLGHHPHHHDLLQHSSIWRWEILPWHKNLFLILTHGCKRIGMVWRCTITEKKRWDVITFTRHLLYLNSKVILSPLLQQLLQQVVESLCIVKARVLWEHLTLGVRHLDKRQITRQHRDQLSRVTSYHQHLASFPHVLSVAGQRHAWSVLYTLARWKSHLKWNRSRKMDSWIRILSMCLFTLAS